MKKPLSYRQEIPFFYDKTEKEFQKDPYERYDPMVIRQSALHLADDLWSKYPMQAVLDFAEKNWPDSTIKNVLEIGCGVGRVIANIAENYPDSNCWGIDYSYQMLKRAREVWLMGDTLNLDLSRYGFSSIYNLNKQTQSNLQFGLAKASALPFEDQSQDIMISSFLLDRLDAPLNALIEMRRVLRPGGTIIAITPLNFSQAKHWEQLFPPIKIYQKLNQLGFEILDWQEDIKIYEPLDVRGNAVAWNCLGFACR